MALFKLNTSKISLKTVNGQQKKNGVDDFAKVGVDMFQSEADVEVAKRQEQQKWLKDLGNARQIQFIR